MKDRFWNIILIKYIAVPQLDRNEKFDITFNNMSQSCLGDAQPPDFSSLRHNCYHIYESNPTLSLAFFLFPYFDTKVFLSIRIIIEKKNFGTLATSIGKSISQFESYKWKEKLWLFGCFDREVYISIRII